MGHQSVSMRLQHSIRFLHTHATATPTDLLALLLVSDRSYGVTMFRILYTADDLGAFYTPEN